MSFFAKGQVDDALEQKAKSMISERVNNKMALILVSTWRYVRETDKEQNRTISVLTKADLALKDGKDILAKRIQKISTESKASECCFVVHGVAKNEDVKRAQLEDVKLCIEGL